ncbi:hypothetical protein L228DRAFT_262392 [Xylona heveae TC161]|uniref:Uncharacterized protein n=1 Tax=Xylona heveae (strain CBS 132557 / TC161) TaxID=1328760 RepID=A0A165FTS8_XYLHT|nr:hypothetical protein L228DRAFT_262392 [Xylona heveae TC161]KZF21368.1 hypothetical protein L228DRAFT_262392 [Xylona heveae TC161]
MESQATSTEPYVYTGPWINWSHGLILGSTLTLKVSHGGLLTAFLALFVSMAGGQAWNILAYIIHQCRARQRDRDGYHHQQQAILRNTGTAGAAAYEFARMIFPWWRRARFPVWRSLPLAFAALLNLALFAVAGVFSSEVTKSTGNETLIRSPHCGFVFLDSNTSSEAQILALQSIALNETLAAANYARACYGSNPDPLQCNQFTRREISWKENANASCPFESGLCFFSDTAAYQMDTGLIDSHDVLGVNAPEYDRVEFRKSTTCAPLHFKEFNRVENDTNFGVAGDQFERLYMGPVNQVSNWTFQYNLHAPLDGFGYELTSMFSNVGDSAASWTPVPELNRTDGDISIYILTPNSISYQSPVDDPFYAAHDERWEVVGKLNYTYYLTDFYLHVIGCVDQYQYCNPTNGECTPLTGLTPAHAAIDRLGFNAAQSSVASRIALTGTYISTYYSVNPLGTAALQATESLYQKSQGPLPNNQWINEVQSWYNASLAKLQRMTVEYASGPSSTLPFGAYLQQYDDENSQRMCRNQKARQNGDYTSFSVLGIAIILVVGSIIILTSMCLEMIVAWIQVRYEFGLHRHLQWVLDEKLQLQRMAYEEAGMGTWSGGTDVVPVTQMGDVFGMPPGVDPAHPRLGRNSLGPSAVFENDGLLKDKTVSPHITEF